MLFYITLPTVVEHSPAGIGEDNKVRVLGELPKATASGWLTQSLGVTTGQDSGGTPSPDSQYGGLSDALFSMKGQFLE